jgi:DNA polymerase-3 subunit epsilon
MLGWFRRKIDRLVLRDRSFRFLFDEDKSGEVVSLDCETTGFDPWVDDVISIAAIRIKNNRILTREAFRAVIKPEARMRVESMKVHRLLKSDVETGRSMEEVFPELLRFIGSRPIIGYWIDFDMSMLDKYALQYLGIRLPNPRIEVSRLYYERKYTNAPQGTEIDLRFNAIRDDLKLPPINQHDAFEDALLAAEMFMILRGMKDRNIRIPRRRADAPV